MHARTQYNHTPMHTHVYATCISIILFCIYSRAHTSTVYTTVYQKHHNLQLSLSTVVPLLRDHPYGPAKWSFKRGGPSKEVYASCTREMYASVTSIAQSDTQGGPSPVGLSKRGCTILSWQL